MRLIFILVLFSYSVYGSIHSKDRENIKAELAQVLPSRNAMVIANKVMDIITRHPEVNFQDMENIIRETNPWIYFVANPLSATPGYCALLPSRTVEFGHSLYICANGNEEAAGMLERLGLSSEKNLDLLAQDCGFLVEKQAQPRVVSIFLKKGKSIKDLKRIARELVERHSFFVLGLYEHRGDFIVVGRVLLENLAFYGTTEVEKIEIEQ
ncbi:MAG: hypothetical protein AB7F43_06850 [Bacteriovoracia bacterium]